MQQVAKAIYWLLIFLVPLILLLAFSKKIWIWSKTNSVKDDLTPSNAAAFVFFAICVISCVVGLYHMDVIITGFVNPEYGAIQDVVSFISTIKH